MDDQEHRTENDTVAELAKQAALAARSPVVIEHEGRSFLIVPEGYDVDRELTAPNAIADKAPARIKQGLTIQTMESLGEYVNRFKTEETILLANIDTNSVVAILDYHGKAEAAFGEHVATLQLPFSFEWATWKAMDGKLVPQLEFARFLEENGVDVIAPAGADLLEVCRDLQAVRKVNFKKVVRTASDNENFEYSEDTDVTGGGIEIPTRFLLSLPVYFGDSRVELYAFLRWRLNEGQLLLGIALNRAEHVRQAVFQQHVLTLADRTDRPAYFGKRGS